MAENLPANLDDFSVHELAKLTGQKQEPAGNMLPTLRVNYEDEDDDGNTLPRGQWSCYTSDGRRIFAKEVALRIFLTKYQYSHYNVEDQTMVSTSVYFDKFGDEAPDTAGGLKCNKIPRKKQKELTDAEQAVQKQIKCSKALFGLLSATGVNQRGEEVEVVNEPVLFYARGTHFMPMSDYITTTANKQGWLGAVVTKLELKKEKNGGVVYWVVVPSTQEVVTYGPDDINMLRKFDDTVKAENVSILDKHYAAAKERDKLTQEPMDDLPFDDDVPENLRSPLEAG